jgi:hypothetical protein
MPTCKNRHAHELRCTHVLTPDDGYNIPPVALVLVYGIYRVPLRSGDSVRLYGRKRGELHVPGSVLL